MAERQISEEPFKAGGYMLVGVHDLPITLTSRKTGQKTETTIQAVLDADEGGTTIGVDLKWAPLGELVIPSLATPTGEHIVSGQPFALDVLNAFLGVRRASGSQSLFTLYFCDSDYGDSAPCETRYFFVVQDGKIVSTDVSFGDSSDFDRAHFESIGTEGPWDVARDAYWYRRFYQETPLGQLMVLRPDEPELFYFPQGRMLVENTLFRMLAQLQKEIGRLVFLSGLTVVIGIVAMIVAWAR